MRKEDKFVIFQCLDQPELFIQEAEVRIYVGKHPPTLQFSCFEFLYKLYRKYKKYINLYLYLPLRIFPSTIEIQKNVLISYNNLFIKMHSRQESNNSTL